MTLSYAHVGDRDIEAAVERVGAAIAELLVGNTDTTPRARTSPIARQAHDRPPYRLGANHL